MRFKSDALILWLGGLAIFALLAGFFGPDLIEAARSYTWKPTLCKILKSEIVEEPFSSKVMHHVLRVQYTYSFAGREWTSRALTTGKHPGSSDVAKVQRDAVRFSAGSTATCYVNPANPTQAVLQRGNLWEALFLLAPVVLMGLMGHEEIFAWFERRRARRRFTGKLPLSETNEALRPDGRALLFGSLGVLLGVFLLGFCLIWPACQWWQARQWQVAEATLLRSEVESRSGMHGPEYSLQLLYEFTLDGHRYQSNDRNFGHALDDGVAEMTAWVAAHPIGSKLSCWFNPDDPTQAVLERDFHIGWIAVALGTLMFGFGIFMFGRAWRIRRWRHVLVGVRLLEGWRGPVHRKPLVLTVQPHPGVVAILCIAGILPLSWAGIWSLTRGIRALLQWHGDLINLLYGAAAAVGAVALAYQGVKFLLRAFRPLPELTVSPGTPFLGKDFSVAWRFRGGREVNRMRLWLEGVEEVRVRRVVHAYHGSVSEESTERMTFARIPLADVVDQKARAGSVVVAVPADLMHSFQGVKCAVVWRLKVEFGRRPSERLEYSLPLTLQPVKA